MRIVAGTKLSQTHFRYLYLALQVMLYNVSMDFLERMRQKPQYAKAQYAFFSALGVTLFIALIWGLSLPAQLSESQAVTQSDETKKEGKSNGLFNETRMQLGSIIDSLKGGEVSEPDVPEESTSNSEDLLFEIDEYVEATTTLSDAIASTTEPKEEEKVAEPQEEEEQPVATEPTVEEPEASSTPPRVILIGTTTSQNSAETGQ